MGQISDVCRRKAKVFGKGSNDGLIDVLCWKVPWKSKEQNFLEINYDSTSRALANLIHRDHWPLDSRMSATFTRVQALRSKRLFDLPSKQMINDGSYQFPTLGFIVEHRTMEITQKLYTKGSMSYLRIETNISPSEINFQPLLQNQLGDPGCEHKNRENFTCEPFDNNDDNNCNFFAWKDEGVTPLRPTIVTQRCVSIIAQCIISSEPLARWRWTGSHPTPSHFENGVAQITMMRVNKELCQHVL